MQPGEDIRGPRLLRRAQDVVGPRVTRRGHRSLSTAGPSGARASWAEQLVDQGAAPLRVVQEGSVARWDDLKVRVGHQRGGAPAYLRAAVGDRRLPRPCTTFRRGYRDLTDAGSSRRWVRALVFANSAHRVLAGRRRFRATAPLDRISRPPPIRSSGAAPLVGTAWPLSPRSGSPRLHNRARRHCRSRRDRATISPAESPGADRLPEREPRGRRGQRDYSRADAMTGACRNLANSHRPFGPIATPVTPIPLLLLAVAEVVPDDDVRLRDSRQSYASGTTGGCRRKREKSLRAAALWMLAQEPDLDPARVPEATGAPIRRHRRRDCN